MERKDVLRAKTCLCELALPISMSMSMPHQAEHPKLAPGKGCKETTALFTSDFSVNSGTPQVQNHSQFKHIFKAKILTQCPFWFLLVSGINDSAFRQGCDTDNLMVPRFCRCLDVGMLCPDIPANLRDLSWTEKSNTYEITMIAFLWLTQYIMRGDVYSGHTETGEKPSPKS